MKNGIDRPVRPHFAVSASDCRSLPHVLRKISILHYLQSLCHVPAPMDDDAPTLIRLPATPAARPAAVPGMLLLTAFVLWLSSPSHALRRGPGRR